QIVEKESGMPINLVSLISEKPFIAATTNSKGQADITAFKNAGIIEIKHAGYKPLIYSYQDLRKMGYKVIMEISAVNLDEFVVSATRWSQGSEDIPQKVISIKPAQIELVNPQTAADLLAISGKVFIQKSQQGGGSPMIRGFATNRLLYSVDGVRMNTAIFRGGNLQNVISLDPFAIEASEVLFGPSSVIYGSDAIGGVMSFQTLRPQLSLSEKPLITGKAATRFSSANQEKTAHFDVNIGLEKWAFVTSFTHFNFDNLRQGSNGPDDYLKSYYVQRSDSVDYVVSQNDPLLQIPSAYSQDNFMQKIRFKPNAKWDVQYGFHYSATSSYGRYDRHNRLKNGIARYAEWNYGPQIWMMNNLSVEHSNKTFAYDQLSIRLAQQSFEESRIDRALNNNNRTLQTENVEAYSLNLDLVKSLNSKHSLYYGAEYVRNDVASKGEIEDISTGDIVFGPSRYPQSTWSSMGVYINERFKVNSKFILQGGLRYSTYTLDAEFDTTFYPFPFTEANLNNGALTGSVGFILHPVEKFTISGNFGTAFRSPNVDDLGKVFDSEPGAVTLPNPDLQAEYAYSFDLGVAKVFGDFLRVDLSGYYTILTNALVRRDFTINGLDSILYSGEMSKVQAIQNAAEATVYGLQATVEVKLPNGFGFSTDLNYQKGEEELDDGSLSPSRHAAPFYGVSRFFYKKEKLHLEFYAIYQGERSFDEMPEEEKSKTEIYALDANGNPFAPSWYTLNVKASYSFDHRWLISAGMENLTDQRYRPYSSGISGAGRNFVISLTAKF
ncbi:MAG: TonB-dependent receptor, partial [Bacteroidales bacterium]|nr:TonB-dependent receptor [Bacteroidales bacterium]